MEKETLEEREPYWELVDRKAEQNNTIDLDAYANGVMDGANWQAERMYTYDEMRTIAYNAYCFGQLDSPTEGKFNEWIQKFKKK